MKQKTVYLDRFDARRFTVGQEVVLVCRENLMTGSEEYELRPLADFPDGIPGNANSSIRCFHGWRGTTNNVYVTALGVREVIAVAPSNRNHPLSDPYYPEKLWKVTVGKDIHPDWE
jgi:hypothetical protein